jgi:hypothetical protein
MSYKDIESAKSEKHNQLKYQSRYYFLISAALSFGLLSVLGYDIKDVLLRDFTTESFYVLQYFDWPIEFALFLKQWFLSMFAYTQDIFNGNVPFSTDIVTGITGDLWGVQRYTPTPSVAVLTKGIEIGGNPSAVYAGVAFTVMFSLVYLFFMGKPKRWKKILLTPFNYLIFSSLQVDDREEISSAGGWFQHFKDTVFLRFITEIDGYERTDFLEHWENYPQILAGEESQYVQEYAFIQHLFFNQLALDDLFLIVEGYMSKTNKKSGKNKPVLFDVNIDLDRPEEIASLSLNSYRCFNGKDEVSFSVTMITKLLDRETDAFMGMLNTKAFKGRSKLSAKVKEFQSYYTQFPERYRKMLFGINNKKTDILEYKFEHDSYDSFDTEDPIALNAAIVARLKVVLCAYFRFICLREIILRYMNLPAGTIVVKVDDYTLRMIIDSYANESMIHIEEDKNSGSNKQFESDVLANLFIFAYWFFHNMYSENELTDRLDFHLNTDVLKLIDEDVLSQQIEDQAASLMSVEKPSNESIQNFLKEEAIKKAEKEKADLEKSIKKDTK